MLNSLRVRCRRLFSSCCCSRAARTSGAPLAMPTLMPIDEYLAMPCSPFVNVHHSSSIAATRARNVCLICLHSASDASCVSCQAFTAVHHHKLHHKLNNPSQWCAAWCWPSARHTQTSSCPHHACALQKVLNNLSVCESFQKAGGIEFWCGSTGSPRLSCVA